MKKVLVIGAAGCVGVDVIRNLLAEGKYDISTLELANNKSYRLLNKYRNRIDIYYDDVLNQEMVDRLIKKNDVVIYLASVSPTLCEYKEEIIEVENVGVNNCIKAINKYNPKCEFIYASSTSLNDKKNASIFNKGKLKIENNIINKIKNYLIIRIPLVLGNLHTDDVICDIKIGEMISVITKNDCARAVVSLLNHFDKYKKQVVDIYTDNTSFRELIIRILKIKGISLSYINSRIFLSKTFTSPALDNKLNDELNYRQDTLNRYFSYQKNIIKGRKISKFLAKPWIKLYSKNKNREQ